jgi:type III pantothenate kinase
MTPLRIAVDIGNSFIHLSPFSRDALPSASRADMLEAESVEQLASLLTSPRCKSWLEQDATWFVATVHQAREQQLADWVRTQRPRDQYRRLDYQDFGLPMRVIHPERVGLDRLAAAVAANDLRRPGCGAIIVDAGTAITVDYLDEDGAFHGGAIMPGPRIASRALHDYTDALPLVSLPESVPSPLGRETRSAIESGLYWGILGGVRELIAQISSIADSPSDLFLTGGGAHPEHFLASLSGRRIPHLTLDGIALTGERHLGHD